MAKGNGTCTGTATDGTHSAPITGIKSVVITTDPAHPGTTAEATCSSLISGTSTALFNATIQWVSGSSDRIANTTITDASLGHNPSPPGLTFTGGTISGSFGGGSISSLDPISSAVVAEVTQPQETGAQAEAASYTSLGCEPTLKLKTNRSGTTASLKAPKGLKKITVTGGTLTASASAAPHGSTAYVTNEGGDSVTPIDTGTNTAGPPISIGILPVGVAITPNGATAYVTNLGGVTPIDTATNTAGAPIPVGNPSFPPLVSGIAITPNGATAYVADQTDGTVVPIDTATNTAGTPIPVGTGPVGIAITPNGATAYVAIQGSDSVTPIDIATNTAGTPIPVGGIPWYVAITPNGATAYVTNATPGTVVPIDTATNTAGTPIPVGTSPTGIAITPNGATAYVMTLGDVTPIDTATNTAGTPIPVAASVDSGIAITPNGATAYAATGTPGSSVVPIDTATDTAGTPITVGSEPTGIAIEP